nr:uroporphyrinogen decarboxylase family protein [uncultured Merdimonas sp.]
MEYQQIKDFLEKEKEEMTPEERARDYAAGKEVDHIPYSLLGVGPALAVIFGYTTKEMDENLEITKEIIRRQEKDFGLRGLNVGLGLRALGAALGSELTVPEIGTDYVKKYVLTDYETLEQLEAQNPRKNPMFLNMIETMHQLKEAFPDMPVSTGVTGPISTAAAIRPLDRILRDTVKDPERLMRLLDLSVEFSLEWVRMFCEEFGKVPAGFSDPVTCMNILSKKQFDTFSKPYIERLVRGLTEITGYSPSAHICGKTRSIWEDLKTIGISSFSIDNCEDLEEAKQVVGDTMQICGNVPPVEVMREGTVDDVIEACKECIRKGADSPNGYQLDTGCQVPIGTPRENLDAFIYAARKYGKGARKGRLPEGILENK